MNSDHLKESFDHLYLCYVNCLKCESERQIHLPQGESICKALKTFSDLVFAYEKFKIKNLCETQA